MRIVNTNNLVCLGFPRSCIAKLSAPVLDSCDKCCAPVVYDAADYQRYHNQAVMLDIQVNVICSGCIEPFIYELVKRGFPIRLNGNPYLDPAKLGALELWAARN